MRRATANHPSRHFMAPGIGPGLRDDGRPGHARLRAGARGSPRGRCPAGDLGSAFPGPTASYPRSLPNRSKNFDSSASFTALIGLVSRLRCVSFRGFLIDEVQQLGVIHSVNWLSVAIAVGVLLRLLKSGTRLLALPSVVASWFALEHLEEFQAVALRVFSSPRS